MTSERVDVIAGVDTHAETHHVAVLAATTGARLGDAQFPTTKQGYRDLLAFVLTLGQIATVGIEGTNSYGAELARFLRRAGVAVVEVIRPARQVRRMRGKSDPIDAYAAAQAVLAGHDLPIPKDADGDVEAIRVLTIARRSAVKARTAAAAQIKSLLVTAPDALRARFRALSNDDLHAELAAVRPGPATEGVAPATLTAMRHLARRHRALSQEIAELETDLDALVTRLAPALRAAYGLGPATAAPLLMTAGDNPDRLTSEGSFASLCGTAPIPASSGKTTRYRLNPGGDRQANAALHQIVLVRMAHDPRTRAYVAKRTAQGKSEKEIMRCLKRAVAREVYHLIVHPEPVPRIDDLRPLRHAKGMTLQTVATHFNVWPARISRIELGKARDDDFANTYREWLLTA